MITSATTGATTTKPGAPPPAAGRRLTLVLLALGLGLGAGGDCIPDRSPVEKDGRQVLSVDLHVHSFLGDGAIPPWNLPREARRRGLDAIAITNHNQVFASRLGRWWSRLTGGAIVLVGQEVTNPGHHIVGVGLEQAVDWRGSAADVIEGIHRAGGLAIAAHPLRPYWKAYDERALRLIDGTERCHPRLFSHPESRAELEELHQRARRASPEQPPAAIGSSDFHHLALLGRCRTLVFADQPTEEGILTAVATARTVAIADDEAPAHGLPAVPRTRLTAGGVFTWLGLLALLLFRGRAR